MKNLLHYIHKYLHQAKQLLDTDVQQVLRLLEQTELKHAQYQAKGKRQKLQV